VQGIKHQKTKSLFPFGKQAFRQIYLKKFLIIPTKVALNISKTVTYDNL